MVRPRFVICLLFLAAVTLAAAEGTFVNFETPAGQPLAVTANGSKVLAVNTPDGRLSVFDAGTLARVAEIPVGLEPTSVAARPRSDEAWVVNNLSDNISVVSLDDGYVVATIAVGDEPVAIAFTPNGAKAYVTVSAENRVAVIDAESRTEIRSVAIPAEDPRALAMAPDGSAVYVVPFESGNQTRVVRPDGLSAEIVHDPDLPDTDLFAIRTSDDTIVATAEHLGTLMTAVGVSPDGGRVYAANMKANNLIAGEENLRGIAIDNRLAILDASTLALIRQVDLDGPDPSPDTANAEPSAIAFSDDGLKVYIASSGSGVVQVLDRDGARLDRISVTIGGRGLASSPLSERLYALNQLRHRVLAITSCVTGSWRSTPRGTWWSRWVRWDTTRRRTPSSPDDPSSTTPSCREPASSPARGVTREGTWTTSPGIWARRRTRRGPW
jgi:YVTN family beta-propeller protein